MTTTDNEKIIALLEALVASVQDLKAHLALVPPPAPDAPVAASAQPVPQERAAELAPRVPSVERSEGSECSTARTRAGRPLGGSKRARLRQQLWEAENGPIGNGTLVGTCLTADCVNPDHFILVHRDDVRVARSYVAALSLYQGLSAEDEAELDRAVYDRCEELDGHLVRKEGTNVMVELPGGRSIGITRALAYLEGLPGTEDGPFSLRRTCKEPACIAPEHHKAEPMPEDTLDRCKVS